MCEKDDSKVNFCFIFISNTRLVLVSKLTSRLYNAVYFTQKMFVKNKLTSFHIYIILDFIYKNIKNCHKSFVSYVTNCFKINRFIIAFAK